MPNGELFTATSEQTADIENHYIKVLACGQIQGLNAVSENEKTGDYYYLTMITAGKYTFSHPDTSEPQTADCGTLLILPPFSTVNIVPNMQNSTRNWIKISGNAFHGILFDCGLTETRVFKSLYTKKTENNFLKIVSEMHTNNPFSATKLTALLLDYIVEIVRQPLENSAPIKYANPKIIPAINIIHREFQKELSIDYLASSCYLNKSYFIRLFKSNMGVTPHAYINKVRIKYAKQFLTDIPNESISQIAHSVGFNDATHFRKVFINETGLSPQQYRNNFI